MTTGRKETILDYVRSRLGTKAQAMFNRYFPPALDGPDNELRAVNRFWRGQLGNLNTDTIDARECLLDSCDPNEWTMLFDEHVLPVIEKHGLPR